MKRTLVLFLIVSFGIISVPNIYAQIVEYNHPELEWKTIETEHFFVHYHPEARRTARVIAKIAEDIHVPLTAFYDYEPDTKVHWIIRDHEDYSNGASFYYDNKIEIWATSMDFELRGTHNWLRNVITHEYTHMINLGAARKLSRQIPAVYFQYLNYEKERRPDVLFGFPNQIVSYPFALTVIPMWFAEGTAQFQLPGLNYENWDTHRDMILRTATVRGYLLSINEMGVFAKTSIGSESVYNHGYSLVSYIAHKYGVRALHDLIKASGAIHRLTFDGASKKVLKIGEKQLHREWKETLQRMYEQRLHLIQKNIVQGEILQNEGTANFYPQWSPDGKKIAFLTNKGRDYLSQTTLVVYDFETKKIKKIKGGVSSSISWSADGTKMVYARKNKIDKYGSHYYDLYLYDLNSKKEKQLTQNQRLHSPEWAPDGKKIVCVKNSDGTNNLVIFELAGKKLLPLTHFKNGEQAYHPRWSHNGNVIVYSKSVANSRDIAMISADGKTKKTLLADKHDSRNPVFSSDDQRIIFSYDKTGIYNLYSMNIKSEKIKQLTNVIGGAFMPTINARGQVAFALYDTGQYKISYLKNPAQVDPQTSTYLESTENFHSVAPDSQIKSFNLQHIADGQYNDTNLPPEEDKSFKNAYSKMSFLPRVVLDHKSSAAIRVGSYFYSSDILNRYSILGGAAINKNFEYDLFALFEYRKYRPTLFFEVYAFRLRTSSMEKIITQPTNIDYFYQLLEIDIGTRFKINDAQKASLAFVYNRYRAKQEYEWENQLIKFSYNYYLSKVLTLNYTFDGMMRYLHSDVHPIGRKIEVKYDYEFSKFIKGFKISQYSTLVPDFAPANFSRITLDWEEYYGLFSNRHRFGLHFQGGFIEKPVTSFLNFFAGGLMYMRGYPYYSMEGRKLLNLRAKYFFSILNNIDLRLFQIYFDKLYGGAFFDYGNAFDQNNLKKVNFKKDVGFELRLNTLSFYGYPAYLFFSGAYGLDKFMHSDQWYGKEWRYYFGLSFGYWE